MKTILSMQHHVKILHRLGGTQAFWRGHDPVAHPFGSTLDLARLVLRKQRQLRVISQPTGYLCPPSSLVTVHCYIATYPPTSRTVSCLNDWFLVVVPITALLVTLLSASLLSPHHLHSVPVVVFVTLVFIDRIVFITTMASIAPFPWYSPSSTSFQSRHRPLSRLQVRARQPAGAHRAEATRNLRPAPLLRLRPAQQLLVYGMVFISQVPNCRE